MQMVLKCADIGHLAADIHTHKRWALQLEEEFFRQVCAWLRLGVRQLSRSCYMSESDRTSFSFSLL